VPNGASTALAGGPFAPSSSPTIDLERFRGAFAVVILPTLNEEAGLERTLSELPFDHFDEPGRRVVPLVIDGGSTDRTIEVARAWNIPVLGQTSRGKGGAMLEAIAWVHRQGIPYVIVLDADATYPPDRIVPALDLLGGGTDLVVGVRRPTWGPPREWKDLIHRIGNLLMSYASSVLSRRAILDLCSGFWGVSTDRFMELGLGEGTFAIEAELVLKSIRRGYSMVQIPVDYRERLGNPKLEAVRDGGPILMTIFEYARPAPPSLSPSPSPSAAIAPWESDLLSIGLTLGIRGAVVRCAPSERVEASRLAQFLQRNLPDTRIAVSPSTGRASLDGSVSAPGFPARESDMDPTPSPFVVSLPSSGVDPGKARVITVSIHSHRRSLTIELPSRAPTPVPDPPTARLWSRAGGWMGETVHRSRESFPSLLVVTTRLNFQPDRQQQTLLSANGFRVVEERVSKDEPASPPNLGLESSSG
jgi:dolichol-phosphate mannosyltransferase